METLQTAESDPLEPLSAYSYDPVAEAAQYIEEPSIDAEVTYTRLDGTVVRAENMAEAAKLCPVLGKLAMEDPGGFDKMAQLLVDAGSARRQRRQERETTAKVGKAEPIQKEAGPEKATTEFIPDQRLAESTYAMPFQKIFEAPMRTTPSVEESLITEPASGAVDGKAASPELWPTADTIIAEETFVAQASGVASAEAVEQHLVHTEAIDILESTGLRGDVVSGGGAARIDFEMISQQADEQSLDKTLAQLEAVFAQPAYGESLSEAAVPMELTTDDILAIPSELDAMLDEILLRENGVLEQDEDLTAEAIESSDMMEIDEEFATSEVQEEFQDLLGELYALLQPEHEESEPLLVDMDMEVPLDEDAALRELEPFAVMSLESGLASEMMPLFGIEAMLLAESEAEVPLLELLPASAELFDEPPELAEALLQPVLETPIAMSISTETILDIPELQSEAEGLVSPETRELVETVEGELERIDVASLTPEVEAKVIEILAAIGYTQPQAVFDQFVAEHGSYALIQNLQKLYEAVCQAETDAGWLADDEGLPEVTSGYGAAQAADDDTEDVALLWRLGQALCRLVMVPRVLQSQ